jgi:transcriptional regulator with PAS, ATPase and Fis domain
MQVDFRLIAATNQNLDQMMAQGKFRKDLFYRLSVIRLHIPPLRERREDILPLSREILKRTEQQTNRTGVRIDPDAEEVLKHYDWPGNARELCNVLEGIACALDGETIDVHHLPFQLFRQAKEALQPEFFSLRHTLGKAERDAIRYALACAGNNKVKAADLLGVHRTILYRKMKEHDIALD